MDNKQPPVGIGVVSILTVLLVLTLSVFASLTLSSARADLALSKINASTMAAYYTADSAAVRLCREFAAGDEAELTAQVPMTDTQALSIHLVREDGEIRVLSWQVVSTEEPADPEASSLPVWDGELP